MPSSTTPKPEGRKLRRARNEVRQFAAVSRKRQPTPFEVERHRRAAARLLAHALTKDL